ncbi:hypothetical protein [Actinosynnema sp. NPDC020468]|uniref:hypothetical protein n=1 Tax=Actinosynnema sp. NPDC020468 TaxID=3154488 RepID=UPI0033DE7D73
MNTTPFERFANVANRPGLYGIRTLDQATSFMLGFDAALGGTFLRGFSDWLTRPSGHGRNLVWPLLVTRRILSEIPNDPPVVEDERVVAFFVLVAEFLDSTEHG